MRYASGRFFSLWTAERHAALRICERQISIALVSPGIRPFFLFCHGSLIPQIRIFYGSSTLGPHNILNP